MTTEEKDLLLKDLCARLPYGVHLFTNSKHHIRLLTISNDIDYDEQFWINGLYDIDEVKPYLRPMSSMTEEEKIYIDHKWSADNFGDIITYSYCEGGVSEIELADIIGFQDWLNTHHFDYRGLIEKGLALEAPKDMYKEEFSKL